jgi:hypothetical protein
MYKQALYSKINAITDGLSEEQELPVTMISSALWDLAIFSIRTIVKSGKLDFELITFNDSEEKMKSKFSKFIDSKYLSLIDKAVTIILEMDTAQDDELAPPIPGDDDKKK